ncbi:MAG: hypothetical protein GC181_01280 [Bacteroidetes bacterium]|nr:hypothetical protein [Bacteroidota bacterium]
MKAFSKIALLSVLLGAITGDAFAQTFNSCGFNIYPGFLVAHRDDCKNLEAHTLGVEFTAISRKINAPWATSYTEPEVALSAMFMNLGHPQLTGRVFAIMPSFSTTFAHLGNSRLRFKVGTGLGFLTKKFDAIENRRNQAIGSHINGSMQLYAYLSRDMGKINFNAGLGITHYSNGSFRVPNLGVNMPSLYLTVTRIPEKESTVGKKMVEEMKWNFLFAYAFKERTLTDPHGFNIFNFEAVRILPKGESTDWRLGSDIYLDKTHHYLDYPGESLKGLKPWEMTEVGVFGGYQWLITRVHLKADIGFYAYKPSRNKFFTYQRLGFDIHLTKNWFLTSNLKTHFGIADHMTWGLGYRW